MTDAELRAIDAEIEDFALARRPGTDAELSLVEAAMFVEEAFGLRLSDGDISRENLGSPAAMRRFVLERAGG